MKVFCTTVIRHTNKGESHGHIYEIDWNNKKIVRKVEMPNPKFDWFILMLNPRGGSRGGRGVHITNDAIYIANDNTIIKYDHNWNEICKISNQLFTGIHEIWVVEDGIWVSSTGIDSAIKIDFSGNVLKMWSPRTDPLVKKVLGIEDNYKTSWPPKWIGWGYLNPYKMLDYMFRSLLSKFGLPERSQKFRLPYHYMNYDSNSKLEKWLWKLYRAFPKLRQDDFHLNCVSGYKNEIFVTLLKLPWRNKACVVNIEPNVEIELGDMDLGMPHNGLVFDDEYIVLNDNKSQGVKVYKRKNGGLVKSINFEQLGVHGKAFFRGLKYLGGNRLLIGVGAWTMQFAQADQVAPVQIIELDLKSETVLGRIVLSNDKNISIHGLDAV